MLADGICMDAEGAVWTPSWYDNGSCCLRVADGGQVLDRIPLEHSGFACALGGDDGRTLFMLTADWHMDEDFMDNLDRLTTGPRTGQLLTTTVSVPAAGYPSHRWRAAERTYGRRAQIRQPRFVTVKECSTMGLPRSLLGRSVLGRGGKSHCGTVGRRTAGGSHLITSVILK